LSTRRRRRTKRWRSGGWGISPYISDAK